ncbi:helix-turn-helix domain-containing protein [Mesorhizobium sp.]|uniref:helix-turn-helix transcriptional regulator n=1 Tax=Mesorhizobium sp. TaxID=1871066 RepID=UPI000FE99459|nr:helix-turn-helix domain-containing protein [Mesorhizobium sp.]RWB65391.1 MAG: DNA-binding protein [Mesorhizobium sp.]
MANIRVRQAAEYVGLSKSNLDKMRCYGGGPAYIKLGNSVIYRTEDLDLWLASNRRASNDNGSQAPVAA